MALSAKPHHAVTAPVSLLAAVSARNAELASRSSAPTKHRQSLTLESLHLLLSCPGPRLYLGVSNRIDIQRVFRNSIFDMDKGLDEIIADKVGYSHPNGLAKGLQC